MGVPPAKPALQQLIRQNTIINKIINDIYNLFLSSPCLSAKKVFYGFASVSLDKSMDIRVWPDQICSFVLGDSWLKLMFLGWPKHRDSSRLLERAMSVQDDLSLALTLPNVSQLSNGLLADGYGAAVVTLQEKHAQMRTSFWEQVQICYTAQSFCDVLKQMW